MKICVLSRDATYGNGAVVAEGLKHFADVTTIFGRTDLKDMYRQTNAKIGIPIPKCDHYVIVGAISLESFPRKFYDRGVTIILTDTTFLKNPAKYNRIISENKWNVFAMPDLAPLNGTKNIFYQPFILPEVNKEKTKVVCHSPFHISKEKEKNTAFITNICVRNNIQLTIVKNVTWLKTIEIKAQHSIVIDKIPQGVGKSGLEAMLLDCAVLSGIKPQGEYLPPIKWTDKENLEKDLLGLLADPHVMKLLIEGQREWAEINLKPNFVAERIMKKICR